MKFFKLNKNYFAISVFAVLFFASCDLDVDESGTSSSVSLASETTTFTKTSTTAAWNAGSGNIFEIESGITTVNITGATKGKNLYLVKRNTGSSSIAASAQPYVTNSSSSSSSRSAADETVDIEELFAEGENWHCYIPPEINFTAVSSGARSATSTSTAVEQISPVVGETTKSIYVDTDVNISTYKQKTATLYAAGKYCYVWIVDDYYDESASGCKVNEEIAEEIAEKFDSLYNMERYVFGEELEKMYSGSGSLTDIENVSDTGSMVNIVLYDIGNDYGSTTTCGVVGYFYARDYYSQSLGSLSQSYSALKYSNEGKYFYVDSAYLNSYFDTCISTLAHEFQHMIRFANVVNNDLSTDSTWYNEMLSMLCEDMLQEHLGLDDGDSPKGRTQTFNAYYYLNGLGEYNSSYASAGYAVWSNFGMFIARYYGGAALVQKLATMNSSLAGVVSAVNSLNGTSYTLDDLFEQYAQALLGSSTYTHNKNAVMTLSYTGTDGDESNSYSSSKPYTYPMTAYDIFDDDYALPESSSLMSYKYSNYEGNGPFVLSSSAGAALRPNNGFIIHGIKELTGTSTTVYLSSNDNTNLKLYLILM